MPPPKAPASASSRTSSSSEADVTPEGLKDKQEAMEMKVQQIWHILSGFEESSAALIGDMLRAVNGKHLLEIILLAERFILHVETLFAVIDDLEAQFTIAGVKGERYAGASHIADAFRNVTRPGGQTTMPKACQPLLNHVTDFTAPGRST